MPLPEALLTELVIMALLATVAKSHHAWAVAVGALDWVEDYRRRKEKKNHHTSNRAHHKMFCLLVFHGLKQNLDI